MNSTSEKLDKILPKVLLVKQKLQSVSKSSNNPFFRSKYADLNTHLEAVEPLLHENGLVLVQPVSTDGANNVVNTTVYDVESGQYLSSQMSLVLDKPDMQKLGAAVTYARRYALSALFSMTAEDDDGETAVGRGNAGTKPWTKQATTAVVSPVAVSKTEEISVVTPTATNGGFQNKTTVKRRL